MKPKIALAVALLMTLGGCVAVWGQSYTIDSESTDAVTIKYDSNFTTEDRIQKVADDICHRYGDKVARLHDSDRSIWRIVTATYDCVAKK